VRYGAALVTVPLECGGGGDPLVSPLRGLISQAENLFRKDTLMRDSGSELPAGTETGFRPLLTCPKLARLIHVFTLSHGINSQTLPRVRFFVAALNPWPLRQDST
jgi:hypothetical protein